MPVQCTCVACGSPFAIKPSRLRRGDGRFCSLACRKGFRMRSSVCPTCGMTFPHIAATARRFCSRACQAESMRGKPCGKPPRPNTAADFWARVDRRGGPDACWPWLGTRTGDGYGCIRWQRRQRRAHRVAYELTHGPILDGLWVLHSCDVRLCQNPAHLRVGTHDDNMRDKTERGRNRAPRGEEHANHVLTAKNVREIRELYAAGETVGLIAWRFGMPHGVVSRIVHRKSWKHVDPPSDGEHPVWTQKAFDEWRD